MKPNSLSPTLDTDLPIVEESDDLQFLEQEEAIAYFRQVNKPAQKLSDEIFKILLYEDTWVFQKMEIRVGSTQVSLDPKSIGISDRTLARIKKCKTKPGQLVLFPALEGAKNKLQYHRKSKIQAHMLWTGSEWMATTKMVGKVALGVKELFNIRHECRDELLAVYGPNFYLYLKSSASFLSSASDDLVALEEEPLDVAALLYDYKSRFPFQAAKQPASDTEIVVKQFNLLDPESSFDPHTEADMEEDPDIIYLGGLDDLMFQDEELNDLPNEVVQCIGDILKEGIWIDLRKMDSIFNITIMGPKFRPSIKSQAHHNADLAADVARIEEANLNQEEIQAAKDLLRQDKAAKERAIRDAALYLEDMAFSAVTQLIDKASVGIGSKGGIPEARRKAIAAAVEEFENLLKLPGASALVESGLLDASQGLKSIAIQANATKADLKKKIEELQLQIGRKFEFQTADGGSRTTGTRLMKVNLES